jgi:hypothetical protein
MPVMIHRPKTDEEMERSARRNLADPREADPARGTLDLGGDRDQIENEKALREFEAIFGEDRPEIAADDPAQPQGGLKPDLRQIIDEAFEKYGPGGPVYQSEGMRGVSKYPSATEQRQIREDAKGEPLRPYRTGISEEQRRAEEREARRERYNKQRMAETGAPPRKNKKLSLMTPEERAEHERRLRNERKRKHDAKKRQEKESQTDGN